MIGPLDIVTERFDPSHGEAWTRYIAWSQLGQWTDLVTLDHHHYPDEGHATCHVWSVFRAPTG